MPLRGQIRGRTPRGNMIPDEHPRQSFALDEHNERWEELSAHPEAQFPSPPFPAFEMLIEAFARLVARHPHTTFIGAHVGCYAENLAWVGRLLDRCPNFFVDISARIPELGRQPYSARRFFLQYADRILFGTDHPANAATYRAHYRFLESEDEYFAYDADPDAIPGQGRWRIYGLFLPEEVLRKVYFENAGRVLGGFYAGGRASDFSESSTLSA